MDHTKIPHNLRTEIAQLSNNGFAAILRRKTRVGINPTPTLYYVWAAKMPSVLNLSAYGVDAHPPGSTDSALQLNRNSDLSNYFESSRKTADLRLSVFTLELQTYPSASVRVRLRLIFSFSFNLFSAVSAISAVNSFSLSPQKNGGSSTLSFQLLAYLCLQRPKV